MLQVNPPPPTQSETQLQHFLLSSLRLLQQLLAQCDVSTDGGSFVSFFSFSLHLLLMQDPS